MKTPILAGLYVVVLLGAAEASDGQKQGSSEPSVDSNMPTSIACSQERGESLGQCSYRIERDEKGKTTVTVVFANGFKRGLFFKGGEFLKASVTMSGVGTDTDWSLEEGIHMIRVDGQRYEVPDILIADN